MYLKVGILHYFYFPYRCWYAIHYQTQMDFQNPISLLPFSISLLTLYAWLTSEHLGPLLPFDLNLSRKIASLSLCREIALGPPSACGCTALSSLNYWGLLQTRTCALEAEPNSGGGGRFRRFLFSSKMIVMELVSVEWDQFKNRMSRASKRVSSEDLSSDKSSPSSLPQTPAEMVWTLF